MNHPGFAARFLSSAPFTLLIHDGCNDHGGRGRRRRTRCVQSVLLYRKLAHSRWRFPRSVAGCVRGAREHAARPPPRRGARRARGAGPHTGRPYTMRRAHHPWRRYALPVLSRAARGSSPRAESTTIALLMRLSSLDEPIRAFAARAPVWGTCAGAILLSRAVVGAKRGGQDLLGAVDVAIERNGFGSQLESFEAPLALAGEEERTFHGVFIRAPVRLLCSSGVLEGVFSSCAAGRSLCAREGWRITHRNHLQPA
jgi:pyridoxal 5'-phosphate synthase glutaminase subunit Pdx2